MKGVFLALEGGDGAGKSSQITLLSDFLKKGGRHVHSVHFPRLDTRPYGELIAQFLRGDFGPMTAVHPKLTALLYALDRHEAAPDLREILAAGDILLADRYIFSNIAYQCAKVADHEERARLGDWIEQLEYGFYGIPRPDLTLYLDVPLEFALEKLARDREGHDRDYLRGGQDIHEASRALQARVREEFLAMAKARSGELGVVDCRGPGGAMADRHTIHSRILDALRYYGVISR